MARRIRQANELRQIRMEQARKNNFQDLPTFQDEIMKNAEYEKEAEFLSFEESLRRQNGILNDINNLERMLELGKMAYADPMALMKFLELPSVLQVNSIKNCQRKPEFDHFI